jgi:hypothetical protein
LGFKAPGISSLCELNIHSPLFNFIFLQKSFEFF